MLQTIGYLILGFSAGVLLAAWRLRAAAGGFRAALKQIQPFDGPGPVVPK